MNDKKKTFVVPDAEVIKFPSNDIIVTSLEDGGEATGGWETNNNGENWWG